MHSHTEGTDLRHIAAPAWYGGGSYGTERVYRVHTYGGGYPNIAHEGHSFLLINHVM